MKKKKVLLFEIVTLFPEMFKGVFEESILGRAQSSGIIKVKVHNLRQWSTDKRHAKVDDRPFGGGPGMVIQAEPVYRAIKDLGGFKKTKKKPWVVYMSPQGIPLKQEKVQRLSTREHIILLCGHYEGIDERVLEYVDEQISVGDYVLTGGEIPSMIVVDAVARLVPGVVGDAQSVVSESFSEKLLDHPHYTRPSEWRGKKVPSELLSGNHKLIAEWRKKVAFINTKKKRPDLLKI